MGSKLLLDDIRNFIEQSRAQVGAVSKKLATGLHACRSKVFWKGFASSPKTVAETPAFRSGYGSHLSYGQGSKPAYGFTMKTACRRGFPVFLEKAGLKGSMARIVACGAYRSVYGDFCKAVARPQDEGKPCRKTI
jgi:hypothetical protein